jgi:hypothetical protein
MPCWNCALSDSTTTSFTIALNSGSRFEGLQDRTYRSTVLRVEPKLSAKAAAPKRPAGDDDPRLHLHRRLPPLMDRIDLTIGQAARTVIVPLEAYTQRVGDSDVMARWVHVASKDVDDSLLDREAA